MIVTDLGQLTEPAAVMALRESASVLRSPEALVIDADATDGASVEALRHAAATLRQLATVTVIVGDAAHAPAGLVDAVDVCLTDAPDPPRPWVTAAAAGLADALTAQPEAALALVGLLRASESLDVWAAVAAEAATYGMLLGSRPFHAWLERRGPSSPKPTADPAVLVEREGTTLAITLNRPDARNAFNSSLRDQLVAALEQAAVDDDVTDVRLSGNGPCFSSGGDLHEFGTTDPATTYAVRLTRHPGLAVAAVASRTTAFLHGSCIGAGIEVPAFAADVVADPDTTFALPEVSMGLIPGAGGTVSIPRRIGRQRTAWLALIGATLDAPTALQWGLVDRVAPTRPSQEA